jgi:methylmalonyl-CoA mutase cobalamin-binding subunit
MADASRVLVVVGIDVARALRDAGFEAIDVGQGHSAASIVRAAVDEDVVAVCVGVGAGEAVAAEVARCAAEIAVVEVGDPESAGAAIRAALRQ